MSSPDTERNATEVKDTLRVSVDRATPHDLPVILDIESASFPTSWSQASYRAEMTNPIARFLVARSASKVVGFALFWIDAQEMHIMKIAVDPALRRQGIATELMARSIESARRGDARIAFLEVRQGNAAALGFYAALGFERVGLGRKYYTDTGEDAILLAAPL